jgi:peroxidase
LVDDLRNFLVSGQFGSLKIDLFAANIQRGRDHGICSYQTARKQLKLPDDSFANIFNDPEIHDGPGPGSRIERQYGTLDKVDLWVGIIG